MQNIIRTTNSMIIIPPYIHGNKHIQASSEEVGWAMLCVILWMTLLIVAVNKGVKLWLLLAIMFGPFAIMAISAILCGLCGN